jgi:hypothetical protein
MEKEYLRANITYKGLTDKGLIFELIDENKKKWTIWKADYKDKTKDSEAYAALKNFQMGDTFGVSYGEKEETFVNQKNETVNFTRRTIYSIMPTFAPQSLSKPQAPKPVQPQTYHSEEVKGRDFDKEAVGKCQTLFLQAFIQSGNSFADAKLQVTQARQLAELVVFGTQQEKAPGPQVEPLPEEEPLPEIPF